MKITNRAIQAAEKITQDARINDTMMSGEIQINGRYIITDGFVAISSPQSYGVQKCKSLDSWHIGNIILDRFNIINNESRCEYIITAPFQLKKLATNLGKLCSQYCTISKYGKRYITFNIISDKNKTSKATFNVRHLMNVFEACGRKAEGKIISIDGLFNCVPFIFVESIEDNVYAIILQSDNSFLKRESVYGTIDKVQKSIDRLKAFEPEEGYYVAFSGGKDSQCIYHLCKMANVKFDAHYAVTTVDPPELIRFIKSEYPDVVFELPYDQYKQRTNMYKLISEHTIPPTRKIRYCCAALKERGGGGRLVVTGVRWAESNRRWANNGVININTKSKKKIDEAISNNPAADISGIGTLIFLDDNIESRKSVEYCYSKKKTTINPIIDWEEEDVWDFLNNVAKVPHCKLYDEGFSRIGCVGCPLAGDEGMIRDFQRWPQYRNLYIKAFEKMIDEHPGQIKVLVDDTKYDKCDRRSKGEKYLDYWLWLCSRDQDGRDMKEVFY